MQQVGTDRRSMGCYHSKVPGISNIRIFREVSDSSVSFVSFNRPCPPMSRHERASYKYYMWGGEGGMSRKKRRRMVVDFI